MTTTFEIMEDMGWGGTDHPPITKQITVIVCGGRDYKDHDRVFRELDALCGEVSDAYPLGDTEVTVRHGGCPRGADRWADEWAVANWARFEIFEADWQRRGRAAGPHRNEQMVKATPKADLCLAFPGGRGTADVVARARRYGIEVREIV